MNAYLRTGLAGLLAAVAMFVWTAVAHMALPLGSMGISQMPSEGAPIAAMQSSMGAKGGLYMFPWVDPGSRDAMKEFEVKSKAAPSGMLIYHPAGEGTVMTGGTLGGEVLKQLACCLIAAFLLSAAPLTGFLARTAFVTGIGIIAAFTDNLSNIIWYGYPGAYAAGIMITDVLSYVFAGLVLAAMIKPPSAKTSPVIA